MVFILFILDLNDSDTGLWDKLFNYYFKILDAKLIAISLNLYRIIMLKLFVIMIFYVT